MTEGDRPDDTAGHVLLFWKVKFCSPSFLCAKEKLWYHGGIKVLEHKGASLDHKVESLTSYETVGGNNK